MTRVVIMANTIDEVGGAQRVVHVVAQELARRGHHVDLVGVAPFAPAHVFIEEPLFRRFTLMSRPWPPPPPARMGAAEARRIDEQRTALRQEAIGSLAGVLADGEPGVVVTAQLWAMEHLAEVPHDDWVVIGQYHSSFEAAASGRDLARAQELYADVARFALLTPGDADRFRRVGLNNTAWLPNPLAFWPDEPVDAGQRGAVTFLGRLAPEKGPTFLVDAWGMIADRHPDWRLRLVGSGPDEGTVRARVAALGRAGESVDMVGPVADAQAELMTGSILALPSLTEGLPLSLAEAMACGLACVATDCSDGVRLLTEDGAAGLIVPRADAAALAKGLDRLMGDADERRELGRRARQAVARYRIDAVIDLWEQLLSDSLR